MERFEEAWLQVFEQRLARHFLQNGTQQIGTHRVVSEVSAGPVDRFRQPIACAVGLHVAEIPVGRDSRRHCEQVSDGHLPVVRGVAVVHRKEVGHAAVRIEPSLADGYAHGCRHECLRAGVHRVHALGSEGSRIRLVGHLSVAHDDETVDGCSGQRHQRVHQSVDRRRGNAYRFGSCAGQIVHLRVGCQQ